jgi:hypothetical protein
MLPTYRHSSYITPFPSYFVLLLKEDSEVCKTIKPLFEDSVEN